jgi:DNA modification methylase
MRTDHRVVVGDSRELPVADRSVDLVVTSPPYPMIEMWDDTFAELDPAIGAALDRGDGRTAFEAMHAQLGRVWDELARVAADGAVVCVNVGDATRRLDGSFELYPNHARVLSALRERGFSALPGILWRKPTNSAAKFMGSGVLPTNAYVTLEHEHVLVLRKGGPREFPPRDDDRYGAAYFWEERNEWFSDVWSDVPGTPQDLAPDTATRERSGAFPLEIPLRLVRMYSAYGDTVLDPFWGTGTTSLAAMVAGRHSVGCERRREFVDAFDGRVAAVPKLSSDHAEKRLADHRAFVERRREAGESLAYDAEHYNFPVTTKRERRIRLYAVDRVACGTGGFVAHHSPVEG